MMMNPISISILALALVAAAPVHAQRGRSQPAAPSAPTVATQPGNAAFAAIAEVVQILEADPRTDWSKVNIEALRQHLMDMDDVLLRSSVRETRIPAGLQLDVTGSGRTIAAIRRMLTAHTAVLDASSVWNATVTRINGGVRLTVVSSEPGDLREADRIRGLGFAGLLTVGSHHTEHHLAIARGVAPEGHAGH